VSECSDPHHLDTTFPKLLRCAHYEGACIEEWHFWDEDQVIYGHPKEPGANSERFDTWDEGEGWLLKPKPDEEAPAP